jgi:hypothetical protein
MNMSVYFRRGVPTTGVMVIAFVPPANTGTGRDADLGSIDFESFPSVLCMRNHLVKNTVSHGILKEYESITAGIDIRFIFSHHDENKFTILS